jgi:hypothetical protein
MTEQELIAKQENGNNETLYLMKVGMFFHAYGAGAFALARLMHYRVKRKLRKGGREVLVAGFPADNLPVVAARIERAGGKVPVATDTWVEFTGVDATEDRALVDGPENHHPHPDKANMEEWRKRILSFDLSRSTPLQALNFLADVQSELKDRNETV